MNTGLIVSVVVYVLVSFGIATVATVATRQALKFAYISPDLKKTASFFAIAISGLIILSFVALFVLW